MATGDRTWRNARLATLGPRRLRLGTVSSVAAVCAAGESDMVHERLDALLAEGVTTVEIKSGYGLMATDELKMLRVARKAGDLAIRHIGEPAEPVYRIAFNPLDARIRAGRDVTLNASLGNRP